MKFTIDNYTNIIVGHSLGITVMDKSLEYIFAMSYFLEISIYTN